MKDKTMLKKDAHAALCRRIEELYKRKNADYGDSVGQLYDKLGDISMLTRISDKYNRLMSLLDPKNTKEPNFESIDDTILDMANYSIIWLMERELKRDEEERNAKQCDMSVADQIANRNKQLKIDDLVARPADVTKLMNSVETFGASLNHTMTRLSETNNMENKGDLE